MPTEPVVVGDSGETCLAQYRAVATDSSEGDLTGIRSSFSQARLNGYTRALATNFRKHKTAIEGLNEQVSLPACDLEDGGTGSGLGRLVPESASPSSPPITPWASLVLFFCLASWLCLEKNNTSSLLCAPRSLPWLVPRAAMPNSLRCAS
jgi:hypothetical protein